MKLIHIDDTVINPINISHFKTWDNKQTAQSDTKTVSYKISIYLTNDDVLVPEFNTESDRQDIIDSIIEAMKEIKFV